MLVLFGIPPDAWHHIHFSAKTLPLASKIWRCCHQHLPQGKLFQASLAASLSSRDDIPIILFVGVAANTVAINTNKHLSVYNQQIHITETFNYEISSGTEP